MKWFGVSLIYIAFFALIGYGVYLTESAMVLWALLLTPSFSTKNDGKLE